MHTKMFETPPFGYVSSVSIAFNALSLPPLSSPMRRRSTEARGVAKPALAETRR